MLSYRTILKPNPDLKPRWNELRAQSKVLVDLDCLETIQHFKYPPWNRNAPYTINISSMSKEEAAMAHRSNQDQHSDSTKSIYTGASAIPNGNSTGMGVGLVAIDSLDHQIHQSQSNLGTSQLVYNGELEAIAQAVEHASSMAQPGQIFQIYSDNPSAIHRLANFSDQPGQEYQIRAILAAELAINKGAVISINWVPGHTDIPGNELADSLAKEATKLVPASNNTSYAHLRSMIKEIKLKEWQSVLDKYESLPSQNQLHTRNCSHGNSSRKSNFPRAQNDKLPVLSINSNWVMAS